MSLLYFGSTHADCNGCVSYVVSQTVACHRGSTPRLLLCAFQCGRAHMGGTNGFISPGRACAREADQTNMLSISAHRGRRDRTGTERLPPPRCDQKQQFEMFKTSISHPSASLPNLQDGNRNNPGKFSVNNIYNITSTAQRVLLYYGVKPAILAGGCGSLKATKGQRGIHSCLSRPGCPYGRYLCLFWLHTEKCFVAPEYGTPRTLPGMSSIYFAEIHLAHHFVRAVAEHEYVLETAYTYASMCE